MFDKRKIIIIIIILNQDVGKLLKKEWMSLDIYTPKYVPMYNIMCTPYSFGLLYKSCSIIFFFYLFFVVSTREHRKLFYIVSVNGRPSYNIYFDDVLCLRLPLRHIKRKEKPIFYYIDLYRKSEEVI